MSLNINNALEVVLEFELLDGSYTQFPCADLCTLTELNMTESVKFHVPLLYLQLEDGGGFFDNVPLLDGKRVRVTILLNSKKFQQSTFRIFDHKSSLTAVGRTITIDAYLDCPKYWFSSSCRGYRGSTSQVIQQIATECELKCEHTPTQDSQLWMQGNMTYAEFVKYLTGYGFAGSGSYMMSGLTLDSKLLYKNVNKLQASGIKVATFTTSGDFIRASDFRIVSNSGLNNGGSGGYASLLREQKTNASDTTYSKLTVKPKETNINLDTNVANSIKRSKVVFSLFNPEQSVNLWHGVYQNDRYSRLYTVSGNLIIDRPTPLTLLTPFTLSAYISEGNIDVKNSGTYIVDTRCIIVRGNRYAERISSCRMGVN